MTEELQCYNRGCCKKYKEDENNEKACRFHPGIPVFHDAYKSWSCCAKKTTDFTEFLNIVGCTVDRHSNVKPVVEESDKVNEVVPEKQEVLIKPITQPMERPPEDIPLVALKSTIGNSLKKLIESREHENNNSSETNNDADSDVVVVGTSCKHASCKAVYAGPESNDEACCFHDGVPVFHEGLKFWSCCQRRTTDFEAFLEQAGCQTGKHLWIKPKVDINTKEERAKSCRYDWHQTATDVVVSIYSKAPIPGECVVEANPVKLHALITFGNAERKIFEVDVTLFGVIDVNTSYVTFLSTKVEICLKKAQQIAWKHLSLH